MGDLTRGRPQLQPFHRLHGISEFADYVAPVLAFCGVDVENGR